MNERVTIVYRMILIPSDVSEMSYNRQAELKQRKYNLNFIRPCEQLPHRFCLKLLRVFQIVFDQIFLNK